MRYDLVHDATITLLSDRRKFGPYGLFGGSYGTPGKNLLIRDGAETELPSKITLDVMSGDIVSVRTPGGGGYGEESSSKEPDRSETAKGLNRYEVAKCILFHLVC